MKYLITFLLLGLLSQHAFGQLNGKVVTIGGQPVVSATVTLLKVPDSTIVKSGLTDIKGAFRIRQAAAGHYMLKISNIGFQTWISPEFELTADGVVEFGSIVLTEANKQLGEVVIRAQKPFVQQEAGGMVVNVQSSIMTKGSSALQVLQRSPGVVIDPQNSNISLNGKAGVMVMMDGKLMRMSMTQVVAMLNGMSADNIEKIELLTTPPAKYDADGNAGLINIVTKKNKRAGTFGSVTASAGYGRYEKGSASININHNTTKTGLYGSYSFSHEKTYGDLFAQGTENVGAVGGQTAFIYNGIAKPVYNYHNLIAGINEKLNANTTIGASVNYTNSADNGHSHNHGQYALRPDSVLLFNSMINSAGKGKNTIGSFYVEKAFGKNEKLNFNTDYIYYQNNSPTQVQSSFIDNHGNQAGAMDSLYAPQQRDQAITNIKLAVAKLDYSKQLSPKIKLEAGAKGTYTRSYSLSGIQNLVNGQWVSSVTTSNNLTTKETIGAAYATINTQIDSATSLVFGARYEYSRNTAENTVSDANTFDRKLGKLFPSIFFTKKLNADAELQLSYTKRITRPSYYDLASYITYNDPVSVFTGNPALKPTITNNLKIGYSYQNYLFSLLFSRDDNQIEQSQISTGPSKQLVYLTPQNIAYQNNIILQANIPVKVNNWWDMTYTFTGGWKQYKVDYTPTPFQKAYFNYSVNFNESFKLPGSLSLELSGYYNAHFYEATSRNNGSRMVNAGIKKDLNNNKGSFQLSVADVFRIANYDSYIGSLTTDAFDSKVHINYQGESRSFPIVKLSYSRSFGTAGNKSQRKQNSASKDERDRI